MPVEISFAFKKLTKDIHEVIEDEVILLHNKLIDAGQAVWDTGNFKNSFAPVIKLSKWKWSIENDANYADILYRGRRQVSGKWYGSEKWAGGIDPLIKTLTHNVERKTSAIRV